MVWKTRSHRNLETDLKRKGNDIAIEDDTGDNTIHIEGSQSDSLNETSSHQVKRTKTSLTFSTPEFEERYYSIKMSTLSILFGKPKNDNVLQCCGLVAMLDRLGIGSLTDLPRVCYPNYVVEFYANLHKDKFDNYISVVKGRRLALTATVMHSILRSNVYSEQVVFTKKGLVKIDVLRRLDQLKLVTGIEKLTKFVLPTTSSVIPMAHSIFKLCWSNICPRSGNRSNFTCQDLAIVSMIMVGKAFDVTDLILKTMYDVLDKTM